MQLHFAPLGVAVGLLAVGSTARAEPCEASRVDVDEALTPGFRAAAGDLRGALADGAQPWGCAGGVVQIRRAVGEGRVRVRVDRRDGSYAIRTVSRPSDLAPTVEALLASFAPTVRGGSTSSASAPIGHPDRGFAPIDEPRLEAETFVIEPAPPLAHAERDSKPVHGAWLRLDALFSGQVTGPVGMFWSGGTLRASVERGAWSGAVWGRYEVQTAQLQASAGATPPAGAFTAGLSAGRRILHARHFALHAAIEPAIAVVVLDGPDFGRQDRDDAVPDMRIGARLYATIPLRERSSLVVGLTGEVSPTRLDDDRRGTALTPLPVYTTGLAFGLGLDVL